MMKLRGSHVGGTQGELEWGRELDMIKIHCMYIHGSFSKDKLKVLFCTCFSVLPPEGSIDFVNNDFTVLGRVALLLLKGRGPFYL